MASSSIDAGPSSSSGLCEAAIFLSHSGWQKPFVESLYNALKKVNHAAFFDQHSLPKGERFPERIKTAARNCTLGVVVLSEEFVTSKWPMLELEILVQQRGPKAKLLPLFFKLKPEDLKSEENLQRWETKWEEMATAEDVKIKWKEAIRALRSFNGEIYEQFTSEARYINRVVESICKQVPSPLRRDLSKMIGYDRLAKEIEGQFVRLCGARHDERACMVGLHREGGGGKTTICKAMVNFYSSKYLGKSHHLELPTNGSDTGIIVQKCEKALEVLADLDDRYLGKVEDIDQVIRLMKDHLVRHNMFLAIDNVWDSSLETAKRILEVGFSSESRILVTSRSQEVLTELFRVQSNSRVGPLPALEDEEAFQIFQKAFELGDLNSLATGRVLIDFVMRRCKFDGTYHALALKTLGVHVKNACPRHHFDDGVVSSILKYISSADLTEVNAVIRLNYDNLEKRMKYAFLDIVLLPMMQNDDGEIKFKRACRLLSALYKNQLPVAMINELCLAGVLQLGIGECSSGMVIEVHDVFYDLAWREAESSSRFFISGRSVHWQKMENDLAWREAERSSRFLISGSSVEKIQWQKIKRVIIDGSCEPQFMKQLQRQKCCRLQVLDARRVNFLKGIDLRLMPFLCVLRLNEVTLRSVQNWSAAALVIIDFNSVSAVAKLSMRLNGVAQLQMLHLDCIWVEIKGLDTLTSLRSLRVSSCSPQRIPDLRSFTQLERLDLYNNELMEVGGLSPTLRIVKIRECKFLKKVPDMSGLTCLERLCLSGNEAMEEVGGLSPTLREVGIDRCHSLKKVPDMNGLTRLEKLFLLSNKSMEEVGGLSPTLRIVRIESGNSLKKVPDMSGLTRLEKLMLQNVNEAVEEVGGLSPTLREVEIKNCESLKRLPYMSGLTRLERLRLEMNKAMEEVGGLNPTLSEVSIENCESLKRVPDMNGLTCLERLCLWENEAMEEVGGLSPTLREVVIDGCHSLKKVPDMSGLTRLEKLSLLGNKSMEEVGGLSPTLREVEIESGNSLKKVPDMSGLTRLEELTLQNVNEEAVEEVGGLSPTLREVKIENCESLKKLPDMSGLTRLERLWLQMNKAMEEVGGLSPTLSEVLIKNCESLKKVPDMSGLTRLEQLTLEDNKAMEEVGGLSPTLRKVGIWSCVSLKKVPDMSGLTRLEELTLTHSPAMEEVGGLSPTLREVSITYCNSLKKVPDMSGLTRLEKLHMADNHAMEEVGGLSPTLREVAINYSNSLKKVQDMSGLTRLEKLWLFGNKAMEEVGGLSPTLREVQIRDCISLKKVPDMSGLTRLESLRLTGAAMEELGGLSPSLREVEISDCNSLKKVLGISGLTRLESLTLSGNMALEEVEGQSVRRIRKSLIVINCPSLRSFPKRYKLV